MSGSLMALTRGLAQPRRSPSAAAVPPPSAAHLDHVHRLNGAGGQLRIANRCTHTKGEMAG